MLKFILKVDDIPPDNVVEFYEESNQAGLKEAHHLLAQWFSSSDAPDKTFWLTGYLKQVDEAGEMVEDWRVRQAIHPKEPECSDADGHVWDNPFQVVGGVVENPGVWGHGGGAYIHECCMNCGCGRVTDTWATDMEDGTEGHTSIQYKPGEYSERLRELSDSDTDRDDD